MGLENVGVPQQFIPLEPQAIPAAEDHLTTSLYLTPIQFNLGLVRGGVVEVEGKRLRVEGVLERELTGSRNRVGVLEAEAASLEELVKNGGADQRGRLRFFGITLRRADIEIEAQRRVDSVLRQRDQELDPLDQTIKEREKEVAKLCTEYEIGSWLRAKYDAVIDLQERLSNPSDQGVSGLDQYVERIGWRIEGRLTAENLKDKAEEYKGTVEGFKEYEELVVGYRGEDGETWVKGLRDYQRDRQGIVTKHADHITEASSQLQRAQERVNAPDKAKADLKQKKEEAMRLRVATALLAEVDNHLSSKYLPKEVEIAAIAADLAIEDQKIEGLSVGETALAGNRRLLEALAQEKADRVESVRALEEKLRDLITPRKRLRDRAPRTLAEAIDTGVIDRTRTDQGRLMSEIVDILAGRERTTPLLLRVMEELAEPTALFSTEESGEFGLAIVPPETELSGDGRKGDEVLVSEPTKIERAVVSRQNVLDLMVEKVPLIPGEVAKLEDDAQVAGLIQRLMEIAEPALVIGENNIDLTGFQQVMKDTLVHSMEVAKEGRKGIRPSDLAVIATQAGIAAYKALSVLDPENMQPADHLQLGDALIAILKKERTSNGATGDGTVKAIDLFVTALDGLKNLAALYAVNQADPTNQEEAQIIVA